MRNPEAPHSKALRVALTSPDALFAEDGFWALEAAYRAEGTRNPALMGASLDVEGYRALADAGLMQFLALYANERLAGFCTLRLTDVLHAKDRLLAITESLFVSKAARKGGGGLLLLQAAQQAAREAGACSLYVNAPEDSPLVRLLPRKGFVPMVRVFARELAP